MNENEAFIYESIFDQVRMGFLSMEEIKEAIIEEIEDNEFEEEISEVWAINRIEEEFGKLLEESKHWTHPTDTEKLDQAFKELATNNIIALHNAGYTTSDGAYECAEVERALREKGIQSDGYCFYHEQDLSRAIVPVDSNLYISFQKINNSVDHVTIEVGIRIANILGKHGFKIDWDESATTKIQILDFRWRKLYDENGIDLLDYTKVIDLMSK